MPPTRYTVVTSGGADDDLTTLWLNHPTLRADITRASSWIDAELRLDADRKGVPDPEDPSLRVLGRKVLRAHFRASEPDRLVEICGYDLLPAVP